MPSLALSTQQPFARNVSCPTPATLSSRTNTLVNKKYSSSTNTLQYYFNPTNLTRNTSSTQETSSTLVEKIKMNLMNFFKYNSTEKDLKSNEPQQSTFNYDPELDLREEHISLISKHLLTTLRESKIKHLSCNNLFLPCNHIRNIAKQCLIMSAEEPFGIMGAQIKIKLTLLSTDTKSTIIKYLPLIRINPKQKTIFELEIDLHEDTKVFTLRRFLPEMKIFKQFKEKSSLYVSPRCLLVKNVFYKTAEPKRAIVDT
ncbi:unnamed protein product [Rotaria magnacalcarata]|uniref:Uncharacterized protein n=3 Tax=Rotaria magnacalcarata TaxID=392030 RepID=A0A816R4E2_9BILA|nr:unnamed protein product [Rotaria magnacalcarata]CAF1675947.1 unnamed protein product [Rotaria magnacalcarata]CAF1939736.1 unnamed protein product [Rotaria magnacalcarata]CAF2069421.1 unnamed protein product [Rotaria magnacalcarata]CAF2190548.1 unnamed protein product [Rotaria magnacalcarata]